MCFSATASFAVAVSTGAVGAWSVRRASERRELPVTLIPLMFAAQQGIEGAVWLSLDQDPQSPWTGLLANSFVFLALVVWPVWAPFSAGLVEEDRGRRLAIKAIFALALPLAYVGMRNIWTQPYDVCALESRLSYSNGLLYSPFEMALYVLCTCGPFLLSSTRALRSFGAILVVGLIISSSLYLLAFISVWCFFAAIASLTIPLFLAETSKARALANARPN
jgi:hypothetical protein